VSVSITINNTGQADLDVRIIDGTVLTGLVDCATDTNPLDYTSFVVRILAGQSFTTNLGCALVTCPGETITATVQGTAVVNNTIKCVFDSFGNAITTAPSSCQACVSCATAVTCRVTGGGVLNPTNTDMNCVLVTTTLSPAFSQVGTGPALALTQVTHGGQLGAPFADQDCGQVLGDPCIRGQWQHVRHYQGKGNPRDVVTAFHSTTPKGQFDTLMCACLGCCGATADQPNGKFLGVAQKFTLCNPDDHRVCGPMPRPAPANAIIFTGVGSLTPTTDTGSDNKKAVWVIFRVYIEDRSEPGGNHPGGAIEPADVYCFAAWYARDSNGQLIPVGRKPDFSSIEPAFRSCLGADSCAFIDSISTPGEIVNGVVVGGVPPGTLPNSTVCGRAADIVDQGPLFDGNHQIHPSTGATCP